MRLPLFRLLACVGGLACGLGCDQTSIQIRNEVPGAVIEEARWVSDATGNSYRAADRLEPGEATPEIPIFDHRDTDEEGVVRFELVIGSNRVVLEAREKVTAEPYENTVFEITPDTRVGNPLLDAEIEESE